MKHLLVLALLLGLAGCTKNKPKPFVCPTRFCIHGIPDRGPDFWMAMKDDDSIGSIYECMDRVHQRYWFVHRGGVCEVAPKSIRAGEHNSLDLKYTGVTVGLQ